MQIAEKPASIFPNRVLLCASDTGRWQVAEPNNERGRGILLMRTLMHTVAIESTASSAYDAGYNVVLVVDAMTDRDADAHEYRVAKVFPRLGEVETTEGVLKMLRR